MPTPTSRDLFRAIQAKNAPAATSVFNAIVKDRLQGVIAREYKEVASDFFGSGKKLTEGKLDRKQGESDGDYVERLVDLWPTASDTDRETIKKLVRSAGGKLHESNIGRDSDRRLFGRQNSRARRG